MEHTSTRVGRLEDIPDLPKIVYKYRTWSNEYHRTILTEQKIFLSPPASFEDPLDCKLFKRYDLLTTEQIYDKYLRSSKEENHGWTRQQHRHFAREWTKKNIFHDKVQLRKMQEEHFEEYNQRFGVLSLTANPANFTMRDKYSEHHTGFCVGFNAINLFNHLGGGGKVDYLDKLPDILPTDNYEAEHYKQVFSKEKKWEFEQEYRTHKFYPGPASNADRQIKLSLDSFSEIIFGAEMPENIQREEIQQVCLRQNLNIRFFIERVDYATQRSTIEAL